jgi:2,3-dihydroxybenzoate decarboxylase
MKRIAVEEHFITAGYLEFLRTKEGFPNRKLIINKGQGAIEELWYSPSCCFTMNRPDDVNKFMLDLGETRIKEMDSAGIDMQLLSLTGPGVENLDPDDGIEWSKRINDELAVAVRKHPDRFAGLAALPFQRPEAAAEELERAVKHLGLRGTMINSNVGGEYLDLEKYWVIFEMAEKLDVPIYLHPKEPSPEIVGPYTAYNALWAAMWGYGAEAGLHIMRLICSGVFDRFPGLKFIIGHMGEALPFWIWRIDKHWQATTMATECKKKPSQYLKDNFYITTSGMFSIPPLLCSYLTLGAASILFAVDYPYESSKMAVEFMETAPICDTDKERILHINAEQLLGL